MTSSTVPLISSPVEGMLGISGKPMASPPTNRTGVFGKKFAST